MYLVPPVVVGYDGSEPAARAVRFAAAEAARRRRPLGIVHVRDGVTAYGESAVRLSAAIDIARAHVAESDIVAVDPIGDAATELLRESLGADLLVVGRGVVDRLVDALGSVSQAAVTRASCPVVVLAGSDPGAEDPDKERGAVVAGVKHLEAAEHILDLAFAEAQLWGRGLEVVHCWRHAHDPVLKGEGLSARLREAVDRVAAKYSDVEVSLAIPRGSPVDALLIAGESAALVVIGAPRFGPVRGTLLASTAQALLGDGSCPVMFVPRSI